MSEPLLPLSTCEVKEQLEVGRWHYIFNEASQLFSSARDKHCAQSHTFTPEAQQPYTSQPPHLEGNAVPH